MIPAFSTSLLSKLETKSLLNFFVTQSNNSKLSQFPLCLFTTTIRVVATIIINYEKKRSRIEHGNHTITQCTHTGFHNVSKDIESLRHNLLRIENL